MRERGKYQIQLMKTRSSSGVGMKIDLDFDIDTLRITDPGEDGQGDDRPRSSAILDSIKRQSQTTEGDSSLPDIVPQPKITAQTSSSKLKDFLNNLGD
jgi:hypothetical protein